MPPRSEIEEDDEIVWPEYDNDNRFDENNVISNGMQYIRQCLLFIFSPNILCEFGF